MEWYETPLFTSIMIVLGVVLTGVVIALMIGFRQKDIQYTKTGRYEEHIKDLINKLHKDASRNGTEKTSHNCYGVIANSRYKDQILAHFKTSENERLSDLYSRYEQLKKIRSEKRTEEKKEEINELIIQFDLEMDKLHEKINHDKKPKFGFCHDCLEEVTSNVFTKLNKKRQLP